MGDANILKPEGGVLQCVVSIPRLCIENRLGYVAIEGKEEHKLSVLENDGLLTLNARFRDNEGEGGGELLLHCVVERDEDKITSLTILNKDVTLVPNETGVFCRLVREDGVIEDA
jgi:hypothetical protein